MQMRMQNAESLTEEQIQQFLTGSETIKFRGQNRAELYGWVERVLVAQEYATRGKKQRGAVRAYIVKMTGLSLPQATRLIRQYRAEGVVEAVPYRRRRFPVQYTSQDVARLAEVDRAHGWLSGPATVRIFQREHQQFGKAEYARLGGISVAHLYNLRGSARYRKLAAKWEPTRPTVALGYGAPSIAGHPFTRCRPPPAMPPSSPPAVTSTLALRTAREDFWRFDGMAAWPDPAGPGLRPSRLRTESGKLCATRQCYIV